MRTNLRQRDRHRILGRETCPNRMVAFVVHLATVVLRCPCHSRRPPLLLTHWMGSVEWVHDCPAPHSQHSPSAFVLIFQFQNLAVSYCFRCANLRCPQLNCHHHRHSNRTQCPIRLTPNCVVCGDHVWMSNCWWDYCCHSFAAIDDGHAVDDAAAFRCSVIDLLVDCFFGFLIRMHCCCCCCCCCYWRWLDYWATLGWWAMSSMWRLMLWWPTMMAAAMATLIGQPRPQTIAMVGCRPAVRQRWNCSRDLFSVVAEDGDGEPSGLSSPCLQLELLSYLMILSWIFYSIHFGNTDFFFQFSSRFIGSFFFSLSLALPVFFWSNLFF